MPLFVHFGVLKVFLYVSMAKIPLDTSHDELMQTEFFVAGRHDELMQTEFPVAGRHDELMQT